MATFDPDAYLKGTTTPEFNPDAYLRGASAPAIEQMPGPRRSYTAAEVPGAAARNLPGSAKQFATGLYEAVTNPLDTLTAVLDLGAGALRKALPESVVQFVDRFDADPQATQRAVDVANKVGGAIADRYGSWENIKRTFAEDPVGAAGDLSTLLFGGATIGRTAAGATALAGAPTVARPIAQAAESVGRAAVYTDPLSAVTRPAQAALGAVYQAAPPQRRIQQQQNQPRDTTIEQAQAEGFLIPPGSMEPSSGRFQVAERIAGKTMLEQLMSVRNQDQANRVARRAVGLPENQPLTREAMEGIRQQEAARGYDPIRQTGMVPVDQNYLGDLIRIEQTYQGAAGSFPQAVPARVADLVNNHLVQQFDSADAVDRIRGLRQEASASFRRGEPDLGNAQRALSNALENQIERHLQNIGTPDAAAMLQQFRDSRQRMAISYAVEDAIREGTGNVSVPYLAGQLQRGRYMTGDLELLARFGQNFPRVSQLPSQIGTPSSGAMLGATNALGAAMGAMTGGAPGAMVGSQAGLLTQAIPAGMRRYLMSQGAQRAARPQYDTAAERLLSDIAARNALMMEQSGEVRDIRNALMGVQ